MPTLPRSFPLADPDAALAAACGLDLDTFRSRTLALVPGRFRSGRSGRAARKVARVQAFAEARGIDLSRPGSGSAAEEGALKLVSSAALELELA